MLPFANSCMCDTSEDRCEGMQGSPDNGTIILNRDFLCLWLRRCSRGDSLTTIRPEDALYRAFILENCMRFLESIPLCLYIILIGKICQISFT